MEFFGESVLQAIRAWLHSEIFAGSGTYKTVCWGNPNRNADIDICFGEIELFCWAMGLSQRQKNTVANYKVCSTI